MQRGRGRLFASMAIIVAGMIHAPAFGQDESDATPQTAIRSLRTHMDITVQADGSYTAVSEQVLSPLTEQAVKGLGQAPMRFREDVSTLEVLEAYTQKQDGRRIDVPEDRIRVTSPQYAASAPVFNALKAKVVVFSDVAVGDRLVVKSKLHVHTPDVPGHFMLGNVFPRSRLYDDVRVSITYPKSMPLKFEARELKALPEEVSGQTVHRVWTFANTQSVPAEAGAVDPWDREPRFIGSTFADWRAIADAYESHAKPMTAVTPAIQKMADEITSGVSDRREQARALYDWVSLNIRYVGVALGTGGFVPHAADSVLANRYGDCKDHVTLLEALLAAKGIASSPVLIHTAPRYETPTVPTFAAFNHAITWLPDLKLYLDSTARVLPFGVLGPLEVDKPVLHTRDGTKLARTAANAGRAAVVNKLTMTVASDGSVLGVGTVTGMGSAGAGFRAQLAAVDSAEMRPRIVEALLRSAGLVGSAEIRKDDPSKLTDAYSYAIDFRASDWLRTDSSGAFVIPSGFFSSVRVADATMRLSRPIETVNQSCGPATIEEHTELTLPAGIKPGKPPKNVSVDDPVIQYTAVYSIEGSTIRALRKLTSKVVHGSCPPAEMAAYRRIAEEVRKDLRTQVVYEAS